MCSNGVKTPCQIDNWIGNVPVAPTTASYMDLYNPQDNSITGKVALSDERDVQAAVEAAQKAFPAWSKLTCKARSQYTYKLRELLLAHAEELVGIVMEEHGKTKIEAMGSLSKGIETVEYACSLPQLIQGKIEEVSGGVTCHEVKEPMGIVASIVPFNFPVMVPMWTLPIALTAGNCVILKPSEKVPRTMARIAELFKEAGYPAGVFQIVNGQAPVVNALCDHPEITAVSFVGSSKVAEIVAKRCRENNKRCLALGAAKNHLVTLPDCNVDMASSDIVASFSGCAGQRCMAASALIICGGQQQELLDALVAKSSKLVPGQGAGQMGPVIDRIALNRIIGYIDQAEKDGCKILLDGRTWHKENPNGHWVGPTIILQNSPNDPAFTDEIFGPVLSVVRVNTKEEAIEIENRSPYGNAACVYTTVGAHAEWFQARFHTGMVGVNIGVPVPREPFSFGGWNRSRFGDMDITGEGGLAFFTKTKKITTKWNPPANKGAGDWMA